MTNPAGRLRHASDASDRSFASQRAASFDLALQVATLRVEQLQRRASNEREDSSRLLAEALSALDNAHAELAAARDEFHEQADEMLATRLERELEWTRYRDLFEAAPVSYIETDPYGVVIEANRKSCDLLSLPPWRVVGKPLVAFVAQVDRLTFRHLLQTLTAPAQRASISVRLKPRTQGEPLGVRMDVCTGEPVLGRAPAIRWVILPSSDSAGRADPSCGQEARATEALSQSVATARAALPRRARRSRRSSHVSTCSRGRIKK